MTFDEKHITEMALGAFSVGALYTPPGGSSAIEVEVVLDFGVEHLEVSGRNYVKKDTDQADFLRSETYPKQGGTLEIDDGSSPHDGRKWELGKILEDDEYVATATLRQEIT